MEADLPQAVIGQQLGKAVGHCVGQDEIAHLVHEQIALVLLVVAVAAELLVVGLLLFQRPQPLGKAGHQRQGAQAGLGLGPVGLHQDVFALQVGAGHDVADGQGTGLKVHRVPPQAQHLAPAQPVEGCELDDQFQPVPPGGFEELLHLLGGVVGGQVLLGLGALHLVHRVAGDQIQLHGVFQCLVQVGVLPQYAGGFQRFQLVEIETLDMPRLQPAQRDAGRLEVGDDVVLYIEVVGGPGGFLHGGADDLQPVEHIVTEQHIGAQFLFAVGFGRREAAAQFPQHLLRPLFVSFHRQSGGVPGLFSLAVGTGIAEYNVVISVFLLQSACYHRHFSFHNRLYGFPGPAQQYPESPAKAIHKSIQGYALVLGTNLPKRPRRELPGAGFWYGCGSALQTAAALSVAGSFLSPLAGLLLQCLAAGGGGSYPPENPVTDFILVPQHLDLAGQSGSAFGGAGRRNLVAQQPGTVGALLAESIDLRRQFPAAGLHLVGGVEIPVKAEVHLLQRALHVAPDRFDLGPVDGCLGIRLGLHLVPKVKILPTQVGLAEELVQQTLVPNLGPGTANRAPGTVVPAEQAVIVGAELVI